MATTETIAKVNKIKAFTNAKPGDIFFSKTDAFVSKAIRWLTGFDYSHVFIKVNNRHIIDSDMGGVKLRKISTYVNCPKTSITHVPLPDFVDEKVFVALLNSKVGARYDYGLVIGHVISRVLNITRWRENIFNAASRYVCSEYIAECLAKLGMPFGFNTSQITPKELYYALTNEKSLANFQGEDRDADV